MNMEESNPIMEYSGDPDVEVVEAENITEKLSNLRNEEQELIDESDDYMNELNRNFPPAETQVIKRFTADILSDNNLDILAVPEKYRNEVKILQELYLGIKGVEAKINSLEKDINYN